jgi:hypothetical protein
VCTRPCRHRTAVHSKGTSGSATAEPAAITGCSCSRAPHVACNGNLASEARLNAWCGPECATTDVQLTSCLANMLQVGLLPNHVELPTADKAFLHASRAPHMVAEVGGIEHACKRKPHGQSPPPCAAKTRRGSRTAAAALPAAVLHLPCPGCAASRPRASGLADHHNPEYQAEAVSLIVLQLCCLSYAGDRLLLVQSSGSLQALRDPAQHGKDMRPNAAVLRQV